MGRSTDTDIQSRTVLSGLRSQEWIRLWQVRLVQDLSFASRFAITISIPEDQTRPDQTRGIHGTSEVDVDVDVEVQVQVEASEVQENPAGHTFHQPASRPLLSCEEKGDEEEDQIRSDQIEPMCLKIKC